MSTAAACFVLSSDRRFEAFVDVGGLTVLLSVVHSLRKSVHFAAHLSSMPHYVVVSAAYALLQVVISFGAIYLPVNGWVYFGIVVVLLSIAYVLFKMKYYCLHEAYLQTKR